jgi:hypothetical protein
MSGDQTPIQTIDNAQQLCVFGSMILEPIYEIMELMCPCRVILKQGTSIQMVVLLVVHFMSFELFYV